MFNQFPRNASRRLLAAALTACVAPAALAQNAPAPVQMPPIDVVGTTPPSLVVPTTEEARRLIDQTPGGVELVPDTVFKDGPAFTIRDILGWVPGVITQIRRGTDARISIRGSGLTRNYGNRGVNLYMDGIPLNSADGLLDLFEIDPTAYRYVEVYKGANALRYGANSLGGAVNFVTPSGRDTPRFDGRLDAGSFGFVRGQASTGGVSGPLDYFVNFSASREDGYREHSKDRIGRFNANVGYQFSPDAETRFYVSANAWRAQLPGEVSKTMALTSPRMANPAFVQQDQQRNIDSLHVANKTTLRFGPTAVEFGIFTFQRHVDHPIFRYLDFTTSDFGGFGRVVDERMIGGFRNRFIAGVNIDNGTIDYTENTNPSGATKGPLVRSELQKSQNYSAYFENSFYVVPDVALVAGGLFMQAVRNREDRFLSDGNQTISRTFSNFSPKVGVLWDVDPSAQVFANISRSAEAPTFDSRTFSTFSGPLPLVNAQKATTYEVGTRGRRPDFTWDLSVYRSELKNELQCLSTSPYSLCNVVNADRTVHQGVELGLGVAFLKSTISPDDRLWFNLAYTYSDFFFDDDPRWGNNALPGVPPQYVRAEVMYNNPNGFYAGPNVEWMPKKFYSDNANSVTVDPYALLNFRIGFDRGTGWSGYVEGRNLLDKRYISATLTADVATPNAELFTPGIGRAVYAGLRFTW